jgi:hypothetical protein
VTDGLWRMGCCIYRGASIRLHAHPARSSDSACRIHAGTGARIRGRIQSSDSAASLVVVGVGFKRARDSPVDGP